VSTLFKYNGTPLNFRSRYNVAPTQDVPVVRNRAEEGARHIDGEPERRIWTCHEEPRLRKVAM
jgi:putative SOS response-associated peptidase YedK